MIRMTNNSSPYAVPTSNVSLSSFAVVIINFVSALLKYNNTESYNLDVCSYDFLILIILLSLNSIDILVAHKGVKGGCLFWERLVTWISLGVSSLIIGIAFGHWSGLLSIYNVENVFVFNGRLSHVHLLLNKEKLSLDLVAEGYLLSSFLQLVAKLFKFKIDDDIKKEVLGKR